MIRTSWNCLVVDAGARYGLHPTWRDARDVCNFQLFEPEPTEANRLNLRYQNYPNITVHAKALAEKNGTRKLTIRSHPGLSALDSLEKDPELMHPDFKFSMKKVDNFDVEAVSIDDFFDNQRVDFLKLDTEGSELEILVGARKKLMSTILGIRVEVNFSKNGSFRSSFSEIDSLLTDYKFALQTLEFESRVAKRQGKFPLSTKSGTLIGGDALYARSPSEIYSKGSNEICVVYALFLYLNGLEDVALQFLVDAPSESNLDLTDTAGNVFLHLLETKVLAHLATAISDGWWKFDEITETYSKLFKRDFPTKEALYLRLYP